MELSSLFLHFFQTPTRENISPKGEKDKNPRKGKKEEKEKNSSKKEKKFKTIFLIHRLDMVL